MFSMVADDIFDMPGHRTVLTGRVESGKIALGSRVDVCSPARRVRVTVAGLKDVPARQILSSAEAGQVIGVVVRGFSIADVGDGVRRVEDRWEVVDLRIVASKSWWKLAQ